ncbi:MAG: hypothetical protein IAE89_03225 [Anaerolineae bacterium]|nr:hypothetical protein [Anaerolineae bacterium]
MSDQQRDPRRITREFMQALSLNQEAGNQIPGLLDRLILPGLLGFGIATTAVQVLQGDWLEFALLAISVVLLLLITISRRLQHRLLGRPFSRRHALYVLIFWMSGIAWLNVLRYILHLPTTGKDSPLFYVLAIGLFALAVIMIRAVLMLTRWFYPVFSTHIPIWEQVLLLANEALAAAICAFFFGNLLARLLQPGVFTLWTDPLYTAAVGASAIIYYVVIQFMWIRRYNDRLSTTTLWLRLARMLAPLALLVIVLLIIRRIVERSDLRSATLLTSAATNLAILAIAPIILLLVVVLSYLIYSSGKGIRQRFLPDLLLDKLPTRLARFFRSISDMDFMLLVCVLALALPAYVLFGGSAVLTTVGQDIMQQGSAFIETGEQALALIVAFPFYLIILGLLMLYAYVILQPTLAAHDRDELIARLPVGFLIILIITLYLFAVPFTQALIEGRLPRLPQDLGRILLFSILIPLVLLYAHYFVLVRMPYSRGQRSWRDTHSTALAIQLDTIDHKINGLNQDIERLDQSWQENANYEAASRFETLYQYVQLNGLRDDMNMQRLKVVAERQQLTELSDAPISVAVARLPLRVVSLGIPLLLLIQIYQWAVLNNGLREIINNPNLNVVDFFREILSQLQF